MNDPARSLFLFLCLCLPLSACAADKASEPKPWLGESQSQAAPAAENVAIPMPKTIKVALLQSRRVIHIGSTGPYKYTVVKGGRTTEVGAATMLKVQPVRGGMVIGKKKYTSTVEVSTREGSSPLLLNKKAYRGEFLLRPMANGTVQVIERVGFEDYLKGVISREVGADWPAESLKAQSVISRTYVIAMMRRNAAAKGFDVTNDVWSQVYGGMQAERPTTSQAVDDTRGQILIDGSGAAVVAFFHSSCGGRTETPPYVWREMKNVPTDFESIKDPFCKADPYSSWSMSISGERVQQRLRRNGYKVGTIKKISMDGETPSGRARAFAVESTRGRAVVTSNNFRLFLGPEVLRSTFITSLRKKGSKFYFEGKGWGHGAGLCQWGARGRAMEGHAYTKILQAYYPNSRLVKTSGISSDNL